MSRVKRVVHGMISSYLLLAATAVYSLASVPLALYYLDKTNFGLWILMGTLSTYFALIDMGMMNAGCRLFIDHKDIQDGGDYGSLIKSCLMVSAIQGAIIVLLGIFTGSWIGGLLAIPSAVSGEFLHLFKIQCGIIALSSLTRIFMVLLLAHQRADLVNYPGIVSLAVNFFSQWLFFHLGFGVLSLSFGALIAALCVIPIHFRNCYIVGVFPSAGRWGRSSWRHFRELFSLGKDLFLVSLGTQMIMASQSIIITRFIGLEAAAVWGVGMRAFYLLYQAIGRLTDITEPVFAEMITRGEFQRLRKRYASLAILNCSIAGWFALSFANCNSLFISLWTQGKVEWSMEYDLLLAIWMILLSISSRHSKFIAVTKKIGFMRYIYFLEGAFFVFSSSFVIRIWGLSGMLTCSIICGILFSGFYGIWRVSRYFGYPIKEVGLLWLGNMATMLLWFIPILVAVWFACLSLPDPARLAVNILVDGSLGVVLFLRFGIPSSLRCDILHRVPPWGIPIIGRLMPTGR